MCANELRAILQSQQKAIRHLQPRLEGLAIVERNVVLDLKVAAAHFSGGDRVASWLWQSGEALRDYLRSSYTAPVRRRTLWATPWSVQEETASHTTSGESSWTRSTHTPSVLYLMTVAELTQQIPWIC